MDIEQAQTFVEMNSKKLTDFNMHARCISGRYESFENFPMIAKPGADLGDVMAAFGALNILQQNLPNEVVLNAVVTSVGGLNSFRFHTDDHTEPSDLGAGCSHTGQAKIDPTAYGVTQEQMDFIFSELPKLVEKGAQQDVLHGNHAEKAIIVIDSETYGVTPLIHLGPNIRSAFIYQKTLHIQQLDKLGKLLQEALAAQGQAVEDHDIKKALDDVFGKQMAETLKRVAPGLPVFTANIDTEGVVTIGSF